MFSIARLTSFSNLSSIKNVGIQNQIGFFQIGHDRRSFAVTRARQPKPVSTKSPLKSKSSFASKSRSSFSSSSSTSSSFGNKSRSSFSGGGFRGGKEKPSSFGERNSFASKSNNIGGFKKDGFKKFGVDYSSNKFEGKEKTTTTRTMFSKRKEGEGEFRNRNNRNNENNNKFNARPNFKKQEGQFVSNRKKSFDEIEEEEEIGIDEDFNSTPNTKITATERKQTNKPFLKSKSEERKPIMPQPRKPKTTSTNTTTSNLESFESELEGEISLETTTQDQLKSTSNNQFSFKSTNSSTEKVAKLLVLRGAGMFVNE